MNAYSVSLTAYNNTVLQVLQFRSRQPKRDSNSKEVKKVTPVQPPQYGPQDHRKSHPRRPLYVV